ncbi:MAG: O-antigen ligase family protein [Polyangiaceae bacterium]
MRRLVQILLFLVWVDESRTMYSAHLFAPFSWTRPLLLETPIASVRIFDIVMFAVLAGSVSRGAFKTATVRPVRRTLLGALGVTLLALLYGLVTGGSARAAGWQSYLPMSMILATFAVAATHQTADHFRGLLKAFVAAGLVHAVMCLVFHFFWVNAGRVTPLPDFETTHDDTVTWTVTIAALLLLALQYPTRRNRILAGLVIPMLIAAIQFNKRRLAWVSLIGDLIALYYVLPINTTKRRLKRAVSVALPVILLYVAIGWGRPESIFRPLRSFQTVSSEQDKSTEARNVENLGLIATASQNGWLMGSGWGHKYVEVSGKYNIYFFELWPYVPHNSVLGLLAYTGYVGFVGYWMCFPMAAFFHARVARQGAKPLDRYMGAVGLVQLVSCADQWYGDMGSFSPVTMYALASSLAMALRLPIGSGVWSNRGTPPRPVRTQAPIRGA